MSDPLDDLELLLQPAPKSVRSLYDRVAPRYDDFRALWMRLAGRGAEQAMLEDLAATLQPGQRVLDAGCGTGAISRQIQALQPEAHITMLDLSASMLDHAVDVPGDRIVGDALNLPFVDDRFDVVVSAWVIETVPNPMRALSEYLRVLSPTGHVFYTFCSLPDGWLSRAGSAFLRTVVRTRFAGDFIPAERTPWHDCQRSHRVRFQGGLTTEIALMKCCTVGPDVAPAKPWSDAPTDP